MSLSGDPLPVSITRNLNDKLYEKRKLGALELEQLVKELRLKQNYSKQKKVIQYVIDNFAFSTNGNSKKGGLIGLASIVIGLGHDTYRFVELVIPPVLKCFGDPDHRVRYYACEALYNISKVSGPLVLQFFCEMFDGMCKLAADPDKSVQDGAALLNKLLQDIVRESDVFDVERFIPLLERRIYHSHPAVRQYLIGWIRLLDSVPNIELLQYLSNILEGLLNMLGDKKPEIAREVASTLNGFLGEVKEHATKDVDFGTLTSILVKKVGEKPDDYTQYVVLGWLHQFIVSGRDRLLPFASELLSAILPSLSHEVDEIRETAVLANDALLLLLQRTGANIPIEKMLEKITLQFRSAHDESKVAALNWVRILHAKNAAGLEPFFAELFPALIEKISDPSESVVAMSLEVMAKISDDERYFQRLIVSLLTMFSKDPGLQSSRGALIIKQLSLFINPIKIFTAMSRILEPHKDLAFTTIMIHSMSVILLTSPELHGVRDRLRSFAFQGSGDARQMAEFFRTLYRAFSHNAVATISLCLLCQLYEHTTDLLRTVASYDMTVDFFCEIDKLVQLLESPVFAPLRLQLLEPAEFPNLFKALYAILMILPQAKAFRTLQMRLDAVKSIHFIEFSEGGMKRASKSKDRKKKQERAAPSLDFDELKAHFQQVQSMHQEARLKLQQERLTEGSANKTRSRRKLLSDLQKRTTLI